ncbi:ChrR family anti-sigma-E factor [Vibrio marisflavi]|uniref:Anti-sigma-E factor ChrR n=1 Tax=Vibrio marisflavi CECT 7928 TaxID=634439 RepID=A0ABM9A038_9VIBR|nr:ChrR family anti-sigma-E factor [Vibrio marisflavi]CAH0536696.1 Anti-sigma-E factor ChrR [Vibrio marisflavi CECT 7928]
MIKHHPSHAVLKEFVSGNLPTSLSLIVASHVEMCPECQIIVSKLTEEVALAAFDLTEDHAIFDEAAYELDDLEDIDTDLVNEITNQPVEQTNTSQVMPLEIELSGNTIVLPRALSSIGVNEWKGLGKISRARLNLDDECRRTSLLCIEKGGSIPAHTHRGFEVTLLLQGTIEDELGSYCAGDFIWLNESHNHTPVTKEGCVCLTVCDDALHFTQGVSKVFNLLGKLIY